MLGAPEGDFSRGEFPGWKGRSGSGYGMGGWGSGMRDVSQRRGRAEMVPSLGAAGQRTGTEHPPYLGEYRG